MKNKLLKGIALPAIMLALLVSMIAAPQPAAAAQKVPVNLITKCTASGPYSGSSTIKYTYKNGLIRTTVDEYTTKFKYSGTKLLRMTAPGYYINFGYTKKGKFKSAKTKGYKYKVTKRKNGRVQVVKKYESSSKKPFQITTISYNKKGHISKVVGTFDYTNEKSVVRYSYDSKGNVVKEKYPSQTLTHKYTYKDGKVISQYNSDWKTTAKYTYKKCWVPKKYAKRVKKQQWAIINYNGYVDDLPLTMVY